MTNTNDQNQPSDGELLREAIRLALDNAAAGHPPFGALVVRDGQVIATGVNTAEQVSDPTAHAEIEAVRAACRELNTLDLSGAIVVSSCEPCAMCHTVCAVAGITRIIYAAPKEFVPDLGGTPRPDLVEMQAVLRGLAGDSIQHIATPGADEPFTRFVETIG
ncbi:nucleoside deaminase [Actinopolymorpha alba]|uniref:nucleoside deaminase n=1 Tax=Actinopolymorpha alba TaxID=533267 RepID=UPI00035C7D13|nr:nucleoside deaminase [Actinopolymorpha alba]